MSTKGRHPSIYPIIIIAIGLSLLSAAVARWGTETTAPPLIVQPYMPASASSCSR